MTSAEMSQHKTKINFFCKKANLENGAFSKDVNENGFVRFLPGKNILYSLPGFEPEHFAFGNHILVCPE